MIGQVTKAGFATLFAILILYANNACHAQKGDAPTIVADEKIQALMRRAVGQIDKGKLDKEAMKELRDIAEKAPGAVMRQIILYLAKSAPPEGERVLYLMGVLPGSADSEIRKALVPFLECDQERTREFVKVCLGNVDGIVGKDRPEKIYEQELTSKKEKPPPGLVTYMFEYDSSKSLRLFGRIYARDRKPGFLRPLLWSDHLITTARWRIELKFLQEGDLEKANKELDSLSKHEGWYARRYVVEMLIGCPKLGTPEIRDRLKKDANPLVSERAKDIK